MAARFVVAVSASFIDVYGERAIEDAEFAASEPSLGFRGRN